MLRPIPGVLYAGRFYADERPGRRPGVFAPACRTRYYEIYDNWSQTEADRLIIYNSKRVARDRPYSTCFSCRNNFMYDHIHCSTPQRQYFEPNACCHCHKVYHLCTCRCRCIYCKDRVCACPLCACTCGLCLKCRQRELSQQKRAVYNEQIARKLVYKFEDEEVEHQRKYNFRQSLHKMQQEQLRLYYALIDCQTFEERGKIKHKLYLNYKLMKDCQYLIESELTESNASDNLTQQLFLYRKTKQALAEHAQPLDEISPSSSQSLPEPQPPLRNAAADASASAHAPDSAPQLRLLKRLIGKNALSSFQSGQDCIKILHPSFYAEESGFTYQGEIVEPELVVNDKVYGFADFSELYAKIVKLFARACLSQFERNIAYALLLYAGLKDASGVLFGNRPLGTRLTYVLPFPAAHQPPFALIMLDGKPVANVGVPFYCGRAMLLRYISAYRRGRFEVEIEFKSGTLLKTTEKAAQLTGRFLSRFIK